MTEFWQFMGEHWFIAWSLSWTVWGVIWCAISVCALTFRLFNRVLRTIKVCIRGWPPAHLDADGDWKPEPESKA